MILVFNEIAVDFVGQNKTLQLKKQPLVKRQEKDEGKRD